ncbi:MAG TPA: putative metal-binding motif-containing protein, partial [Myxococcota bacterium]|nr:putative metal-binding motif-containing protein [Myxococcota bacterium]
MRVFLLPLLLLLACPPPVKIDSADSRPVIDSDSPCVPAPEVCDGEDNNCNGEVDEPGAGGEKTWYADTDADAYGDAEKLLKACLPPPGYVEDNTDCDDQQAGTHPGAPEQCNGIDDDCDGIIDPPDSTDVHLWYADADDDGFGDPATSFASCLQPAGYVENGEDCNDRKADVHPEADEYCNEEDDNCNGEVDEDPVDPHSWYVDADGDGYGAAASAPLLACVAPPSTAPYSAINSDCDDSDSTIHPGAIEVCDATRADEDCNGVADDADPGVTGRS